MTLEFILGKIVEYAPKVGFYVIVFGIFGYLVYKATCFYKDSKTVHKDFPNIKSLLERIDKGFNTLNTILLEKNVISQSCYSNGNSPRVINEKGESVLQESGGNEAFEATKEELLTDLSAKQFSSLLELERESLNVLLDKMGDQRFSKMQDFAFSHPTYKETPLTYTDILLLLALKLRDLYREKHPEIK